MLNRTLLAERADFNPFTRALKRACQANGAVLVRMRNGSWLEIQFQAGGEKHGPDDDSFRTKDHARYWYANGQSVTSRDFDLIEFNKPAST